MDANPLSVTRLLKFVDDHDDVPLDEEQELFVLDLEASCELKKAKLDIPDWNESEYRTPHLGLALDYELDFENGCFFKMVDMPPGDFVVTDEMLPDPPRRRWLLRPSRAWLIWLQHVETSLRGSRRKRTTKKRASRAANIEKLTREMVEHLRAARDHAFATRDRTGTAELLPRPMQKELASRVALSESAVSRCLKDPEARQLKFLWDSALDLDKVMGRKDG